MRLDPVFVKKKLTEFAVGARIAGILIVVVRFAPETLKFDGVLMTTYNTRRYIMSSGPIRLSHIQEIRQEQMIKPESYRYIKLIGSWNI